MKPPEKRAAAPVVNCLGPFRVWRDCLRSREEQRLSVYNVAANRAFSGLVQMGQTSLMLAACGGRTDVVRLLLEQEASVDAADKVQQ